MFFLLFATFCARAPYAAISFLNFFLLLLNLIECTITVITRIKVTALWNIAPRIMATTANIATMVCTRSTSMPASAICMLQVLVAVSLVETVSLI